MLSLAHFNHMSVRLPSMKSFPLNWSLTCTVLADDNTEVDGGPVWVYSFTVGTHLVGPVRPDLLSDLVV